MEKVSSNKNEEEDEWLTSNGDVELIGRTFSQIQ